MHSFVFKMRAALPAAAIMLGVAAPAAAQKEADFANPPVLQLSAPITALRAAVPDSARGAPAPSERQLDLRIAYTENSISNPIARTRDKVRLRSYTGAGVDPRAPFVAPTVEANPGDTVRITLHNELPYDPSCIEATDKPNVPHCFNGTNLHGHGLWVSPTGNSDNVTISINPQVSFQYEYNLPADHPAGTFWYHTHVHGSTALQVSSGMAGALVIRGNRLPTPTHNGDIDTLLKTADGKPIHENLLVLQQIQYACYDQDGNIKVRLKDGSIGVKTKDNADQIASWYCAPGDVGGVEYYTAPNGAGLFGPGTWNESGRYTTINGRVRPRFQSVAGRVERWRIVHAGVRDTVTFKLHKLIKDSGDIDKLSEAEADDFVATHCAAEETPYYSIASDGLTMAAAQEHNDSFPTTLQPGYRSDALVVFPDAGNYCVVNAAAPAGGNLTGRPVSRRLLGTVKVAPGQRVTDIRAYLTRELVKMADLHMPATIRAAVKKDLRDGLRLSHFTRHKDIPKEELTGAQSLYFNIQTSPTLEFQVGNNAADARPYQPGVIDRHLMLGGVEEWTLQSGLASHPFHIHVNPFQIVAVYDPNGKDVSTPDSVDDYEGAGKVDPQYRGTKGQWKDTIWVKNVDKPYTVVVRTRYQRYIGQFVLHCHILDHEDQGMMQNISIDLPNGKGGAAKAHH